MPTLGSPPLLKIRIVIADDHVAVREGLAAILDRQADMEIVGRAANGEEAVQLWRELRPDVLLVDMRMPFLDGVGVIEGVRSEDCVAKIIVLSTFDTDTDVARAVKAGAKGYLLKDAPVEDLLASIRTVAAGATSIPPDLVAKLAASLSVENLTQRELEVLALLACGDSNRSIGDSLQIGEATVKSHLRNLFNKLDVISRTEAVSVARRRGLVVG
jgi:DNA-binding NarL/FixJ family response regulator